MHSSLKICNKFRVIITKGENQIYCVNIHYSGPISVHPSNLRPQPSDCDALLPVALGQLEPNLTGLVGSTFNSGQLEPNLTELVGSTFNPSQLEPNLTVLVDSILTQVN